MTDDRIEVQTGQVIHPKSNHLLLTAEIREQTSGDQWGDGSREEQYRVMEGKGLLLDYVKLF